MGWRAASQVGGRWAKGDSQEIGVGVRDRPMGSSPCFGRAPDAWGRAPAPAGGSLCCKPPLCPERGPVSRPPSLPVCTGHSQTGPPLPFVQRRAVPKPPGTLRGPHRPSLRTLRGFRAVRSHLGGILAPASPYASERAVWSWGREIIICLSHKES